jgi:hypothetical protein
MATDILGRREYNIPEFNLPLETNSFKQHLPQSFGSVRTDVSPQHSKQPNIVTLGAEVSGPCDVHTTESDVVGKLFAVRYRVLEAFGLLPKTYMCSCSYVACSPLFLSLLLSNALLLVLHLEFMVIFLVCKLIRHHQSNFGIL